MRILSILLISWLSLINMQAQTATEIIKKADALMQGESNQAEMTMKIIRPTWERSITMKSWSLGTEYSMVLLTAPAKEKGQVFLKRKNEMWNYVPTINRMIKLPASMMSQGWMGSDFTNDDLLNESSIVVNYLHKLLGNETVSGYDCYIIEMVPKAGAPVVWGKVKKWISKKDYFQLKTEYYDEDFQLIRTENASEVKKMDNREIPTQFEIIPADVKAQKTQMVITSIKFNIKLDENFFSQQKMKTIK